jgi:hypothetical protein
MSLIQILGLVLLVAGVVSFAFLLYVDITKHPDSALRTESGGFDLPGWLAKLPARYLPSVGAILLGWAMYDPASFADTLKKLGGGS